MRRKDREMDKGFGLMVIDKSTYGILSVIDDNGEPYGILLSIARYENKLYFHSTKEGKKIDIFKRNSKVSIIFVGEVKAPEIYSKEELDELVKDESKGGLLISKVFTTEYELAIVRGRIELVEDEEERIKAMKLICQKYTPSKMDYFDLAIKWGLKRTKVYKIEIEDIKAKRKNVMKLVKR